MVSWNHLSKLSAALVLLLGVTTLVGWYWHVPALLHWYAHHTPIVANTGLCFVLCGLGILLRTRVRSLVAILAGVAVLAISSLTLTEYLFDVDLRIDELLTKPFLLEGMSHPGRISPTAATALFFAGVALTVASGRTDAWSWRAHVGGLCGVIVFAIGLAGFAKGLPDESTPFRWYPWTPIAPYAAIGLVLLGLSLHASFVSSRGFAAADGGPKIAPLLPPYLACAVLVLATMTLRTILVEKERIFVEKNASLTARTLAKWIEDASDHAARAFFRMARNWGDQLSDPPRPRITKEGASYLEEFTYFRAIALMDTLGSLIWTASKDEQTRDWTTTLGAEAAFTKLRENASRNREPFLAVTEAASFRQVIVIVPVIPEQQDAIRGFVLGIIHPGAFLEGLVHDVAPGYGYRVSVDDNLVFETPNSTDLPSDWWSEQVTVSSHDVDWNLWVQPGADLVSQTRGPFSTVVLVLGVCIAFLSGMTIALAEQSAIRVREIEAARCHLEDEMQSRHKAEESLRASEERYALAMSGSFDGLWDWNIARGEYYFSDRWHDLLGVNPSELRAPQVEGLVLVHPDDKDRVIEAVRRHLEHRVPFDVEARLRTSAGDYRWFQARGKATLGPSGKPARMTGSIRDIHDQKRAEEQLRTLNKTLEIRVAERTAAVEQRADALAKSEAELHQQTRILRSILEGMSDAVLVADTNGRFVLFNRAAEEILGVRDWSMEPSEWANVFGCRLPDGVTPYPGENLPLALAIRGQSADSAELLVRNATSREDRWISCNARPLADDRGNIWGGVAVFRDVTQHRALEQELRHGEERLRMALAAARMGTWELDATRETLEWAEHEVPVVGPRSTQFRGTIQQAAQRVHPDDRQQFLDMLDFTDRSIPHRVESHFRIVRDSGHLHWIEAHGRAVSGDSDSSVRIIGTFVDVTERIVAQQALRLQSEIVANVAEGIALIRARDLRIVYANATFEEMHGYGQGELNNSPFSNIELELATPNDGPSAISKLATGEMQSRRKDGRAIWCQVNFSGFEHSEHGDVLVGVFTDITEQKRAREEIERSLREKEVLLKEIHHRVKNNLQVVSSLLSLQAADLADSTTRNHLTDSQNRIRSMALIHESLYRSTDLAKIDFSRYAKQLAGEIFSSQAARTCLVELRIDAAPIELGVDAAIPCGLILNELVSNALRHAFPERQTGSITVGFRRLSHERLCLSVADDGVGLSRPFDIAESTSLGFRLVLGLTEQLGGDVEVKNEGGLKVEISFSEPLPTTMKT